MQGQRAAAHPSSDILYCNNAPWSWKKKEKKRRCRRRDYGSLSACGRFSGRLGPPLTELMGTPFSHPPALVMDRWMDVLHRSCTLLTSIMQAYGFLTSVMQAYGLRHHTAVLLAIGFKPCRLLSVVSTYLRPRTQHD